MLISKPFLQQYDTVLCTVASHGQQTGERSLRADTVTPVTMVKPYTGILVSSTVLICALLGDPSIKQALNLNVTDIMRTGTCQFHFQRYSPLAVCC